MHGFAIARHGVFAVLSICLLLGALPDVPVLLRAARAEPVGGLAGAIDLPAPSTSASSVSGVLDVQGWAVDARATSGPGVALVRISLDGAYVTEAVLGDERADVESAFGPTFAGAGWQATLDLPSLVTSGPHVLEVQVTSAVTLETLTLRRALQVSGDPRFCVNTHLLWFSRARAARDLDRARGIGLASVRFDVRWDRVEPEAKGRIEEKYVTQLEDTVDMAIARGLHPVLTVLATPAWARNGAGTYATPPANPVDFGDVMGYLARRLADRPGLAYEIWNEPNHGTFWDAPANPWLYGQMLRAAYDQIKAAAPAATVVGGSLVFNDPVFLAALYEGGAAGTFDALSLHPYAVSTALDPPADPTRSFRESLEQARSVLAAYGDADKPIWITELGWTASTVDDVTRAGYLNQAVALTRATPQIALFCAYELNQDDDRAGPEWGLIAPDGSPTHSWLAYARAIVKP
jgi:hypothetical protein